MLFARVESLVDKRFSCPRLKLSDSQTSLLDSVETGVLLSDLIQHCVEKTQSFPTFTLPYLTPLVYLPVWIRIKRSQTKTEEAGSFSK